MTLSLPPTTPLTTAHLTGLGFTPRDIARHVREGTLVRRTHGVYDRVVDQHSSDPFRREREAHLALARCVTAALPGSYLVGPSAAIALGLPVKENPAAVHVARETRIRSARPEVISHRGWGHERHSLDGVTVQSPSAVVVQLAAQEGVLSALITADAAARRKMMDDDSATVLTTYGSRPGASRARIALSLVDARRESPLETEAAWQAHREGITLEPQFVVLDDLHEWVATVDFKVAGCHVLVEVDGIGKYRDHRDFRNERLRHNQIEELGWIVVRITATDLQRGTFTPRLRAAIARASHRP